MREITHYELNKSINATVNIFIFSFFTYLFQSISTRRESLSRINIFHNYTVSHEIKTLFYNLWNFTLYKYNPLYMMSLPVSNTSCHHDRRPTTAD